MHAALPLELREKVYEYILDTAEPIVVPRLDSVKYIYPMGRIHCDVRRQDLVDPFAFDDYFSATVMDLSISTEVQDLAL